MKSVLPIGILPFDPLPPDPTTIQAIPANDPDADKFMMNIVGTAFQVGDGKLATCRHVVEALIEKRATGYVLTSLLQGRTIIYVPFRVVNAVPYLDPRSYKFNPQIDLAILLVPAKKNSKVTPYKVPTIRWGDSTRVGVGDVVAIAGFPLGTDFFRVLRSNRGIIQPTVFDGVVSSVLPTSAPLESRLFQLSMAAPGGVSGGPVFSLRTGEVFGMATSGLDSASGDLLPFTFAIPSEIIRPYVQTITFKTRAVAEHQQDA